MPLAAAIVFATLTAAMGAETPFEACDRLAAQPAEPGHLGGGVDPADLDMAHALPACRAALTQSPSSRPTRYRIARLLTVRGDFAAASWSMRWAATFEYSSAELGIALQFEKGRAARHDLKSAFEWTLRAALHGNVAAAFSLASKYANAVGTPYDRELARHWYQVALDGGSPEAELQEAEAARFRRPPDSQTAGYYYRRAISHGSKFAIEGFGALLLECGCAYDIQTQAVALLQRAADLGILRAYADLGRAYAGGLGVKQDLVEAVRLYKIGADGNDPQALFDLAGLYEYGEGVAQDPKLAMRYYARAAEAGNTAAYVRIGTLYQNGIGVTADPVAAQRFYQIGAQAGDARAELALGKLLMTQDIDRAVSWLEQAGTDGEGEAYRYLIMIFSAPNADIGRAIAYAETCSATHAPISAKECASLLPSLREMQAQRERGPDTGN